MSDTKQKRTAWDERADMVRGLRRLGELIETVEVPADLAPAIATGRPELLALAKPRALTEEECGKIYNLLRVLIRTNMALQQHAQEVAVMAENVEQMLRGNMKFALRLSAFANFTQPQEDDDE